jgi:hypothetical protein
MFPIASPNRVKFEKKLYFGKQRTIARSARCKANGNDIDDELVQLDPVNVSAYSSPME